MVRTIVSVVAHCHSLGVMHRYCWTVFFMLPVFGLQPCYPRAAKKDREVALYTLKKAQWAVLDSRYQRNTGMGQKGFRLKMLTYQ